MAETDGTSRNSRSVSQRKSGGKEEAMKQHLSAPKSPLSPLSKLDSTSSSSHSTPSDEAKSTSSSSNSTPSVEEHSPETVGEEQVPKTTPSLFDKLKAGQIVTLEEAEKLAATRLQKSPFLEYSSLEGEDLDPKLYYEKRLETLAAQKAAGKMLYSHRFTVKMTIPEFLDKYGTLKTHQYAEWAIDYLAGRVIDKRSAPNLICYDLVGFGGRVQVMAFPKTSCMNENKFFNFHSDLKIGDYIGVAGFPGTNCTGELCIISHIIVKLSCCLHKMPPVDLNVKETRYRRPFLDLTVNSEIKDMFKTRSKVVSYVRHFLENLGFLEVETPTLTMVPTGAATRPFETHHDGLNKKVFLRNTSGRYLMQLLVGGIERVYEIGKQFRNEGIDLVRNHEFTTCEFYMALADYRDLMKLTEEILSGMVKELTGGYKVTYHAHGYDNPPIEIDFTPPFRRIFMIEELEKMANLSIPKDLASDEARQYLADACTKFGINCSPPQTTTRLFEKLVGHFLEVTCVDPTFIIDHPEITSPIAKTHEYNPGLTERFTLFINKLELVNGYTVENDPVVQHQRFAYQVKNCKSGDEEAMPLDETFLWVLEYGIPPSAGWALGIDRLTMLLTDSLNIKEVILFPAMNPQHHYEQSVKGEIVTAGFNYDVEDNTSIA